MSFAVAMAQAAESAPSDNTVAIVALGVSAVVGIAGPIITAIAADRRSKREQDAATDRQAAALEHERGRLEQQLAAERERLDAQLAAERERLEDQHAEERSAARLEAARDVLDRGARLLTAFRSVMGEIEPSATPGEMLVPPRFNEVTEEVGAHRGRLLLWFPSDSDIVTAFDEVLKLTHYIRGLETGAETVPVQHEDLRPKLITKAKEDFESERLRYLEAARRFLGGA